MTHAQIPTDAPCWRMEVLSDVTLEQVRAYLPSNYRVHEQLSLDPDVTLLVITGTDVAGWDVRYVRDRLSSGLIATTDPVQEVVL